jgi:hypothetical protein
MTPQSTLRASLRCLRTSPASLDHLAVLMVLDRFWHIVARLRISLPRVANPAMEELATRRPLWRQEVVPGGKVAVAGESAQIGREGHDGASCDCCTSGVSLPAPRSLPSGQMLALRSGHPAFRSDRDKAGRCP